LGVLAAGVVITQARPRVTPSLVLSMARKNLRFPRALLPSWLIDRCTTQAYLSVFSGAWGEGAMGSLALYMRLIGVPQTMIGNAVGDVVRQRAAEDLRTHGTCRPLFRRAGAVLLAVGAPGAVALVLFAPWVLPWALGPRWTQVGTIAQILAPHFAFAMVVSPLSAVLANRPGLDLITKSVQLALLVPALVLAPHVNFATGIALFCGALCGKYLVELHLAWRTAGGSKHRGNSVIRAAAATPEPPGGSTR